MGSINDKEYVSLLEMAVSAHPNAPCDKIVKWKGPGDLPTTLENKDIDDLVDKITKGDKTTAAETAIQKEDTVVKDDEKNQAPLSILENELDKAEVVEESSNVTDQESEILDRLIKEMDAMDAGTIEDEMLDTSTIEPDDSLNVEPTEDLELGVPQEEYELDDLDI